jgi:hypothetical protein
LRAIAADWGRHHKAFPTAWGTDFMTRVVGVGLSSVRYYLVGLGEIARRDNAAIELSIGNQEVAKPMSFAGTKTRQERTVRTQYPIGATPMSTQARP